MSRLQTATGFALALAMLLPVCLHAQDVGDPPLPRPRPTESQPVTSPLPTPLPEREAMPPQPDATEAPASAPEPQIYQTACPAVLSGMIVATALPPIADGICQVRSPLSATGLNVGGREVTFSAPAIVDCALAGQLAEWVSRIDAYTRVMFTSPVTELLVGTSYDCRPRNDETGAKVSDHGFADAVDITGLRLENGAVLSLPEDWAGDGAEARAMHYAHDAACGLFTTVLGPDANALHHDHLHLDLGCHGATCTYRMCE